MSLLHSGTSSRLNQSSLIPPSVEQKERSNQGILLKVRIEAAQWNERCMKREQSKSRLCAEPVLVKPYTKDSVTFSFQSVSLCALT